MKIFFFFQSNVRVKRLVVKFPIQPSTLIMIYFCIITCDASVMNDISTFKIFVPGNMPYLEALLRDWKANLLFVHMDHGTVRKFYFCETSAVIYILGSRLIFHFLLFSDIKYFFSIEIFIFRFSWIFISLIVYFQIRAYTCLLSQII
jgi:hypothetical protein